MYRYNGGDAPFRPEKIYFTVIEIIGRESVDAVSGGVEISARAGTYGRAAAGISLMGISLSGLRSVTYSLRNAVWTLSESTMEADGNDADPASYPGLGLADSQKQLVDVAKRYSQYSSNAG